VALIKSPIVLERALGEPEVKRLKMVQKQSEAYEWLVNEIRVEFKGKILHLSLTGDDPSEVATVIKAVTAAYLRQVAYKEKAQRAERNEALKVHYANLQKEVQGRRAKLNELAIDLGSKDRQTLSLQQRLAITQQAAVEQELLGVRSELRQATGSRKRLQAKAAREAPVEGAANPEVQAEDEVAEAIRGNQVVMDYVRKEGQLKSELAHARSVARQRSEASVVAVQRELNKLQKQRKEYEDRLRDQLRASRSDRPAAPRSQAESRLAALEDEIAALLDMERDLEREVSRSTGGTKKLGTQALEMETIQEEIGSALEMAKLVGAEIEALKIELKAPDRVRLLEEAKAPPRLGSTGRVRLAGMAAGGAFGAIALLVSFREFRARRVDSHEDVTQSLGINVIGTVPVIRRAALGLVPRAASPREELWQHRLTESIDTTRIMLSHLADADSIRVVLVTSAVSGEGKTSLASCLATSLARSGRKTLLIDGDLRWPMVHQLFDHAQRPGLSELVRGEVGADDAIRPTAIKNLWIIPAGREDEHARTELSQPRARAAFNGLRERFDFVIVDSAPVLPVADTLLLSQHVDAALFSILRDVSQVPRVHEACGRIASLGIPILGAVVSGARVDAYFAYPRR
jgi:capsular exopolysaccharide synthesis family protein